MSGIDVPAHRTREELEAGLDHVRSSPPGAGVVELIVRRPDVDEREVLDQAVLDVEEALVGDNWRVRGRSGGRPSNPNAQITVANTRAIGMIAGPRELWPLAGDQLYVDLDLSLENLPPGTRLEVGAAVLEVTEDPHTGCAKFSERFGLAALELVSSPEGRALNLRGINTRVVNTGAVRAGDAIRRL